jgi:hypothetical protein
LEKLGIERNNKMAATVKKPEGVVVQARNSYRVKHIEKMAKRAHKSYQAGLDAIEGLGGINVNETEYQQLQIGGGCGSVGIPAQYVAEFMAELQQLSRKYHLRAIASTTVQFRKMEDGKYVGDDAEGNPQTDGTWSHFVVGEPLASGSGWGHGVAFGMLIREIPREEL